jgi:hypothetical protein
MRAARAVSILAASFLLCATLSGCLVAGYTSGEGWWVWPGSLGITLILLALYLLSRR